MTQVPQGACDDVSRDGGSSSRVHVPSFWRSPVELAGMYDDGLTARVWCGDFWSLTFGDMTSRESKFWLTQADVDALIGELLAAREQFRMERDAKALMVEALGSLVADSEDDIPW